MCCESSVRSSIQTSSNDWWHSVGITVGHVILLLCLLLCLNTTVHAQRQPRKPATPAPTSPPPDAKQTIQRVAQAWASNDAESLRRTCSDGLIVIEAGRRIETLPTVLEYLEVNFKNFPSMELKLDRLQTHVTGTTAWAYAETQQTMRTAHGLSLRLTGHSFYILQRQRQDWKVTLINFDLKQAPAPGSTTTSSAPSVEGAWMLVATKNLTSGQTPSLAATMTFTDHRFCYIVTATDRRQPKNKRLPDYSQKEFKELLREVDAAAGTYRHEGNKLILTFGHTLMPQQTGQELVLENVQVTADRLSFEIITPEGRVQRVWRRVD
ncbi:MAG: nuclear transport factor 2 family protein [Acidobacteriota bacterium]|nr:nuclear transport factor 2 family protein [Blastocatellia bacterium]MDW8238960.1 nuclear transport factor 2 family protein [Acidobacteriota bacterium]